MFKNHYFPFLVDREVVIGPILGGGFSGFSKGGFGGQMFGTMATSEVSFLRKVSKMEEKCRFRWFSGGGWWWLDAAVVGVSRRNV